MRKNIYILMLLLLAVSLFLWGCNNDGVVAVVNGEKISAQELDEEVAAVKNNLAQQGIDFEGDKGEELEKMLRRNMLDQLINRVLIMQEAERRGLLPTGREVREEVERLKKELGSEGQFKKFLAANGINEPRLEELLKHQLAAQKLQEQIKSQVARPTEAEIEKYYNDHREEFTRPEQRQVSHILIGTGGYAGDKERTEMEAKVLALQVAEKLKAGADFAELAEQYSDDPGSKENGGQYPPFSKNSGFAKEFEEAAFSLQEGEFTAEPVRTRFGYHIIKLDKIIPGQVQEFSEVKDAIAAGLYEQALMEELDAFMQDLRGQAEIENYLAGKENDEGSIASSSTKN